MKTEITEETNAISLFNPATRSYDGLPFFGIDSFEQWASEGCHFLNNARIIFNMSGKASEVTKYTTRLECSRNEVIPIKAKIDGIDISGDYHVEEIHTTYILDGCIATIKLVCSDSFWRLR